MFSPLFMGKLSLREVGQATCHRHKTRKQSMLTVPLTPFWYSRPFPCPPSPHCRVTLHGKFLNIPKETFLRQSIEGSLKMYKNEGIL